jgi:Carboxypeptidase regulatory-like domain
VIDSTSRPGRRITREEDYLSRCFLWLVGAGVTGLEQVDTGAVVGTIKDASGAVVPNATATATNATATATNVDTGITTAVKSASDGNYVITPLKIGRYSVSAEAAGFRTEVRQKRMGVSAQ